LIHAIRPLVVIGYDLVGEIDPIGDRETGFDQAIARPT
jgi:hypothetical protein